MHPESASNPPALRLKVSHDFSAVRAAASQVRSFLKGQGLGDEEIWACELALVEGCNNAVQNVAQEARNEQIILDVTCNSDRVDLRIQDHTEGFDLPGVVELPASEQESGRGLYLIKTLMDEVRYVRNPSCNCLLLQKNRTALSGL